MLFNKDNERMLRRLLEDIHELRTQIKELQDQTRMYNTNYYGPELRINDAVRAIADHLNIQLEAQAQQVIPQTAVVVPKKPTSKEK